MMLRSLVPTKKLASEKIEATAKTIGRDLQRLATKLETEEDVIAKESLAMVEGDTSATKRLDDARDRRDRLMRDRDALNAALNLARTQLAQAKADEDDVGRKKAQKRLDELLARRVQLAKQIGEAMIRLRDLIRQMMADVAEINSLRRELMNQTKVNKMWGWRELLEQPKTDQRLAEAAHAMGLAEVFPVSEISSFGCDMRPFHEVEEDACKRARWHIAYSEEVAGGAKAPRLQLRRADGTA